MLGCLIFGLSLGLSAFDCAGFSDVWRFCVFATFVFGLMFCARCSAGAGRCHDRPDTSGVIERLELFWRFGGFFKGRHTYRGGLGHVGLYTKGFGLKVPSEVIEGSLCGKFLNQTPVD